MIVVADAGPLIHLAGIGQLDLIRRLSPSVLVPESVYREVVVVGAGRQGMAHVELLLERYPAAQVTIVVCNTKKTSPNHLAHSNKLNLGC